MIGMDARTGHAIADTAHLGQSIADLLTTPLGSRTMRRNYGSLLFDLIDRPFNDATRVVLYGAIATAVMRWEPRIRLTRVALAATATPGAFELTIDGRRTDVAPSNAYTRLTLPLRLSGG